MKQIKEHELKQVPVNKIKVDGENPNIVTPEQLEAMRYSMEKFGYLAPIIVDQDFIVADGEHRLQIYKEFGKTTIPCYIVECNPAERKLIRQTMNKLHGVHDSLMDAQELKRIIAFDEGMFSEITNLLAIEDAEIEKILKLTKIKEPYEPEFDENIVMTNKCPKCGDEN